jgi:hypothetical protein
MRHRRKKFQKIRRRKSQIRSRNRPYMAASSEAVRHEHAAAARTCALHQLNKNLGFLCAASKPNSTSRPSTNPIEAFLFVVTAQLKVSQDWVRRTQRKKTVPYCPKVDLSSTYLILFVKIDVSVSGQKRGLVVAANLS